MVYVVGEVSRILFWHNPWSGSTSLKELYPELFVCAIVQESLIFDLIFYALDSGGRSWNLLFGCDFNDWETGRFYSFLSIFLLEHLVY